MFELLTEKECQQVHRDAKPDAPIHPILHEARIRGDLVAAQRRKDAQVLGELLEKHRAEDLLCCPEDCFCWDIEVLLEE